MGIEEGKKHYLGDGVYVESENGMVKLTTSDGISDTNTIYLEYEVYLSLLAWVNRSSKRTSVGSRVNFQPEPSFDPIENELQAIADQRKKSDEQA